MTKPNGNVNKDERALEAFLAAAFRLDFSEEISGEQAEKFFQQPARLSEEDKEAISSWGIDFIEELLQGKMPVSGEYQKDIVISEELEQEYFAMNRDKEGSGLDEEIRKKIEEERKKALDEEEKKNKDQNNES